MFEEESRNRFFASPSHMIRSSTNSLRSSLIVPHINTSSDIFSNYNGSAMRKRSASLPDAEMLHATRIHESFLDSLPCQYSDRNLASSRSRNSTPTSLVGFGSGVVQRKNAIVSSYYQNAEALDNALAWNNFEYAVQRSKDDLKNVPR